MEGMHCILSEAANQASHAWLEAEIFCHGYQQVKYHDHASEGVESGREELVLASGCYKAVDLCGTEKQEEDGSFRPSRSHPF